MYIVTVFKYTISLPLFPYIFSLFSSILSVGAGITIFTKGKYCNEFDAKPFMELFGLCGHCEEVPERTIPGLGAISGSGSAFVSTVEPLE